jgi:hypothetical protein
MFMSLAFHFHQLLVDYFRSSIPRLEDTSFISLLIGFVDSEPFHSFPLPVKDNYLSLSSYSYLCFIPLNESCKRIKGQPN